MIVISCGGLIKATTDFLSLTQLHIVPDQFACIVQPFAPMLFVFPFQLIQYEALKKLVKVTNIRQYAGDNCQLMKVCISHHSHLAGPEVLVSPCGRTGNTGRDVYPQWPNQDRVHSTMISICIYLANVVIRSDRLLKAT